MPVESTQKKNYLVLFILGVLLILFYQWASSPLIVTVSGVGSSTAAAQSATVTFSLTADGENSQAAIDALRQKMQRVKEKLTGAGVHASDVYESQVTVYPASASGVGATGFQSTVSMGVKSEKVEDIDNLTTSLYALGAAVVAQPTLTAGNMEELDNEAYAEALGNAKKQAAKIGWKNLKLFRKIVLIEQAQSPANTTVTTKASVDEQVEQNLSPDQGVIKINKVLSVSYKMW